MCKTRTQTLTMPEHRKTSSRSLPVGQREAVVAITPGVSARTDRVGHVTSTRPPLNAGQSIPSRRWRGRIVPGGRVQGVVVVANSGDGNSGSFHYLEQTTFARLEQRAKTHSAHRYSMSISRTRFCCRMIST